MAIYRITTSTDDSYVDIILNTSDKEHPYIEIDPGSYEAETGRNPLIFSDLTHVRDLSRALEVMADELDRYKDENNL